MRKKHREAESSLRTLQGSRELGQGPLGAKGEKKKVTSMFIIMSFPS